MQGGIPNCGRQLRKLGYLICPRLYPPTIQDVKWSEWLESIRKDVECTFGILKARWRWLRSDILNQDKSLIGAAMRTAAILHNVVLHRDHLETDYTKTKAYWNALDPDLFDRDAGADGENQDFGLDFTLPTQGRL